MTLDRTSVEQWLGTKDLLADGIEHGSRSLERSQQSLLRRAFSILGRATGRGADLRPYEEMLRFALATGHGNVRLVSRLASTLLSGAHHLAEPALKGLPLHREPIAIRSDIVGSPAWLWDSFIGSINGMVGDHLSATDNPLATPMSLRRGNTRLDFSVPAPPGAPEIQPQRLCVFVHGLGTTEWSWSWEAEKHYGDPQVNYGSQLEKDLGFVPIYVRYNTGKHISDNGRDLADLLQSLVAASPDAPRDLVLVGHSMGGLVAHSGAHYGREAGHDWIKDLRQVVSIAAPHDGAPLEKISNLATTLLGAIDTPGTRIPAEIIDARSAGIKDLRHGYIVEEDWQGQDPDRPLNDTRTHARWVDGVSYHRIVATLTQDPAHPMGRIIGDVLVRRASAAASNPAHGAERHHGEVVELGGISHIGLANHPLVYNQLRTWLDVARRGSTWLDARNAPLGQES